MGQIHLESILRGHARQCRRYEKLLSPPPQPQNDGNKVVVRRRPRRRWLKKMSGGIRLSSSRSIKLRLMLSLKALSIVRLMNAGLELLSRSPMAMNVIFSTHWGLPTLSNLSLHPQVI
ncbi:hypothetical protein ERO13_A11G275850v2 [Gossypium hirsutum]|uniref:Uncharacterized protein n=4 Tax=Gossypium TaxID=3633 RepID=A0A2P5Y3X5_GOSBA|nr:hypothetical protein ES319_A11G295100v1 [Gossypium barbadense]KAG4176934.1 hypothetical protein ERO13_A11G275850v2 [Gossypium hirsutum]TYG96122.1 hypothetical protein ES288_A11G322100v1 [Gossypium darwinii]TYI03187.1 hypothetical protein ES332_A11G318600v1 [Gossypium tomentosum]TYJ11818.1 hypothetical protein E1A91_A11G302700v1 [Gossypium mustelinum]